MIPGMDKEQSGRLVLNSELGILYGEDAGRSKRSELRLDEADNGPGPVVVKVEAPVVTSAYIQGLLEPSVRRLGLARFRQHYTFEASRDVRDNIDANVAFVAEASR